MTMLVTEPTQASPGTNLADRRRAALERLHGRDGAVPGPAVRRRPAHARAARRTTRRPRAAANPVTETLGPPPVAYYVIAVVVVLFVALGLVMVLSSSAATEVGKGNSPYRIFSRQVLWACVGLVGLLVALRVPYQRLRHVVWPFAVVAAGAMALPFVPSVGAQINDARAWVVIGSFSFQPSEVLKLASLMLAASLLASRHEELAQWRRGLLPLVLVAGLGAGACLAQGDLGSAIVLGSIVMSVAFIAGVPLAHMVGVGACALVTVALFVLSSPRRFHRFTAFMDVEGNKDYLSYQTYQGFLGMADGGLTGSGIGGSNSKLGYLPLAHSDFIFAIIADELGMVGTIAVLGGFAVLVWFGIQTALAAPDRFGMLLAGGITTWFGVQAVVNLGGVTGLLPVTGLTLPFFSAGGTSLCISMVAAGVLLNVARRAR